MRLLLVEDEARLVEITVGNLQKSGFVVDAVSTGAHAFEALQSVAYDAVILDLGLPDCDGIDLLNRIRRQGSQVPILILTARDSVDDRVNGLDQGADDYL